MANWKDSDRDLVAEQPGLGLSFIGLFLAFFMGLAIRAAVSPDRVENHLHQAIENIHKDIHISFSKAYVSFARGIWPDLSVVIEDVRIESQKGCWLTPLAEINEIRLPLSMKHLFGGEILIHEVLADEVNLSLRSPYENCTAETPKEDFKNSPADTEKNPLALKPTSNPGISEFKNVNRKNPIDTVEIAKLRIHYLPIAFTSFTVQDFQVSLKSEEPRWIQILGLLQLDGDTLVGEYNSQADLKIDILEGNQPSVNAFAKGVWREGHYEVSARYESQTENFDFDANAKHLPLSQIIPILKKYRWVESEFNGKQAWVSGQVKLQSPLSKIQKAPVNLMNLKLEGDLGEVTCAQAQIESFKPFQFKPVDFHIRGLSIKDLLVFLNRPHPSPALGELGTFNGVAHFVNPESLQLRGDYSGLEFIFSNQGQRQSQVLSLISGELELKKNQWDVQLDRIKPIEGIFEGKVQLQADKDFKELKVDAQITELGLSPSIQSLMTGGGSLGALQGQIKVHLQSAQIKSLQGHLRSEQVLIEGLHFAKPKIQIQTVAQDVEMQISALELEMNQSSRASHYLSPLLVDNTQDKITLKSPSATLRTKNFTSLTWRNFQAGSPSGALRSHGAWDSNGVLSGEMQILGKSHKFWNIHGTRAQPQFALRKE